MVMSTQRLFARIALAVSLLGGTYAQGQTVVPPSGFPDACKLMQQSDIEALFPGRPVTSKGPTLSPIYKGPQYVEGCQYAIQLPSPTSKLDTTVFATLTITKWGGQAKALSEATETFASIRHSRQKVAANPSLQLRIEPLPSIGDEAFQERSESDVAVRVRKDDLIFVLSLGKYSPQTQSNAAVLAAQAAKRWLGGTGMIEAAAPIASNAAVEVPPDTRVSLTASADQWPDACALLKPEDVQVIFADMKIDQPHKTMGRIKYQSHIDRVEDLPNPIRCDYTARKSNIIGGRPQTTVNSIEMSVSNVATTVEASRNYYVSAQKVGGADTPLDGLGDEASISIMNQIYIRKGVLTVALRVGGGETDQVLHADARKRVLELAKRVANRLP